MRTNEMIRKNAKTLRAALIISLALLATACGSTTSNRGLRNYAGKMKSLEYYKDFTDYENPKQSDLVGAVGDDDQDYFPPETHVPDVAVPKSPTVTPSATTTPAEVTPTASTPSTITPAAPPIASAPATVAITPVTSTTPITPTASTTPITPTASTTPITLTPSTPNSSDCRTSNKPCFPVAGDVHFSDDFGARRSGGRRHAGNDIFAAKLTPVVAIEDGIVDRADRSASDGSGHTAGSMSGNYVGINHGNGVRSLYIHLNNDSPGTNDGQGHGLMPDIQIGTHVKKGQIIGWVGNSGNAETTPPHLHFEMRVTNDKVGARAGHKVAYFPVNPYSMLKETEGNKIALPRGYEY